MASFLLTFPELHDIISLRKGSVVSDNILYEFPGGVLMSEPISIAKVPMYKRVYADLRMSLKSTKYSVGSLLPTEAELQKHYGVSRTTVRRAVALLAEEGLVKVIQGRGTEVQEPVGFERYANVSSISTRFTEKVEKSSRSHFDTSQINISLVPAKEKTAAILGLGPGSSVYCLQRVLTLTNGVPAALLINYLPPALVPNFKTYTGKFTDLYTFLDETYGIKYLKSTETISAKAASILEANTLNVEIGSPLLHCCRTAYCAQGPMEYAYSTYNPELFQILINMDVHDYALV